MAFVIINDILFSVETNFNSVNEYELGGFYSGGGSGFEPGTPGLRGHTEPL